MALRNRIVLALFCFVLLPGQVLGFDGERQGFVLGLGAGYGHARDWYRYDSMAEDYPARARNDNGVATTFKIGGGVSEKIMIYYSNRVVVWSHASSYVQGMSAAAVSYFLEPRGRSFYFSGELGFATRRVINGGSSNTDSHFGFTVGAGYEFATHFTIEANYMYASTGGADSQGHLKNFSVALTWLAY